MKLWSDSNARRVGSDNRVTRLNLAYAPHGHDVVNATRVMGTYFGRSAQRGKRLKNMTSHELTDWYLYVSDSDCRDNSGTASVRFRGAAFPTTTTTTTTEAKVMWLMEDGKCLSLKREPAAGQQRIVVTADPEEDGGKNCLQFKRKAQKGGGRRQMFMLKSEGECLKSVPSKTKDTPHALMPCNKQGSWMEKNGRWCYGGSCKYWSVKAKWVTTKPECEEELFQGLCYRTCESLGLQGPRKTATWCQNGKYTIGAQSCKADGKVYRWSALPPGASGRPRGRCF